MTETLQASINNDDKKILTADNFAAIRAKWADYSITIDEFREVDQDTRDRFRDYLKTKDANRLSAEARNGFSKLIAEVGLNPPSDTVATQAPKTRDSSESARLPEQVRTAGAKARQALDALYGKPESLSAKQYLGLSRRLTAVIPGFEVSSIMDIQDLLYQSRDYNMDLIQYLEDEATDRTADISFNTWGKGFQPGWYPSWEKTTFKSVQDKQAEIIQMLDKMTQVMIDAKKSEYGVVDYAILIASVYVGYRVMSRIVGAAGSAAFRALWTAGKWALVGGGGMLAKAWGAIAQKFGGSATIGTTSEAVNPEAEKFNELANNAIRNLEEWKDTEKFPTIRSDGTATETTLKNKERTNRIKEINKVIEDYKKGKLTFEQAKIRIGDAYSGNFFHIINNPESGKAKWQQIRTAIAKKTGLREEITAASLAKGIGEMNKIEAFDFADDKWELQHSKEATPVLRELEMVLKERDIFRQAQKLLDSAKNQNKELEKLQERFKKIKPVLASSTVTTTPVPGGAPQTMQQSGQSANPEYTRMAGVIEAKEQTISAQIAKIRELHIEDYRIDLSKLELGVSSADIVTINTDIEAEIIARNTDIGTHITTLIADHGVSNTIPTAEALKTDTFDVAMKRILRTVGKMKPRV